MPELSTFSAATTFYNFVHGSFVRWSKTRKTMPNKTNAEFTSGHKIRNSLDIIISPERAVVCNCNLQNAGGEWEWTSWSWRVSNSDVKIVHKRTDDTVIGEVQVFPGCLVKSYSISNFLTLPRKRKKTNLLEIAQSSGYCKYYQSILSKP